MLVAIRILLRPCLSVRSSATAAVASHNAYRFVVIIITYVQVVQSVDELAAGRSVSGIPGL